MQLLKIRDFSELFTDTFTFIKENAKHFFINFFLINSLFIIGYILYNYFISKMIYDQTLDYNPAYIFLFVTVFVVLAIVYWAFTPIYMLLYQEKGIDFKASDMLNFFTNRLGKILIFIFMSILMGIALMIPFFIIFFILVITIVGIFAIPLLVAALALWFQLAFMEYMNTKKTYFEAFGYAFTLFTKKFWATVGSSAVLHMVIMVVYYLVAGAFGMFSVFSNMSADPEANAELMSKIFSSPMMMVLSGVMIIASILIYINIGIIYFSQKELLEGIQTKAAIDDLGKNID